MIFGGVRGGGLGPTKESAAADDDLYEDFNYSIPSQMPGTANAVGTAMRTAAVPGTAAFRQPTALNGGRPPPTQMGRLMTGAQGGGGGGGVPGTAMRGPGEARPMTSVAGAGYQSKSKVSAFDPLRQGKGPAPALAEKGDNSPEDMAREMEKAVHKLIEKSAEVGMDRKFDEALELAKEADKKEKALCKHRERHGLVEQINLDLTYSVCFNLAHSFHAHGMLKEALREYSAIVKNKQYPQAGRLRANMGNIYYEQGEYLEAIKNYRMALDQIPNTGKEVRFKIFRNIGTAFVRMGQFSDAIPSYETIMGGSPNFQTGFNLILCYYALQDVTQMRKAFQKLVAIPIPGLTEDDEEDKDEAKAAEEAEVTGEAAVDGLRKELRQRQKEASNYLLTAAKLISPVLDTKNWEVGYDWVFEQLKPDHEHIASQMEIEKALQFLKKKQFDKAIEHLRSFEKKDQHLKAMASTDLSFICFLEGEFKSAHRYADMAIRHDRYNAKALVNKGNCLFMDREYYKAKEVYLEAIGVEVDCVEAIFNLGLVNIQLGQTDDALQAFEKLHTILPNNAEVMFHIANMYENQHDDLKAATKWFNMLLARVPSDPGVLSRLGQIANKEDDESEAFKYHIDSYRHYPVNLDVISWLGVWYVKSELYEKAIHFFERASQIQPNEVKWSLMVTSCYRRMGDYHKALELYEKIHADYPENLECLRYLMAICKDLGRPCEVYQQKLARLDRGQQQQQMQSQQLQQQQQQMQQQQEYHHHQQQQQLMIQQQDGRGGGSNDDGGRSSGGIAAPGARTVDRRDDARGGLGSGGRDGGREDDDFGDADVTDLLA